MQRKFLIPFIKYAKRGDLIHCTPDTTQKQSAWAERNFSGDSPWVIYDNSSSQTQGPIWLGYHFYCPVSRSIKQILVSCLCFKSFVSVEETCCMQSPSLVSLLIYITINYFHNEQRCNLELRRKERFSSQYLFVIMISLKEVEQQTN